MCHFAMGLTHCYKTTVFFTFYYYYLTFKVSETIRDSAITTVERQWNFMLFLMALSDP